MLEMLSFNLVIENLLISTKTDNISLAANVSFRFNLVIENLLISTEIPGVNTGGITFGFNLVIENLLISTQRYAVQGIHGSIVSIS